MLVRADTKRRWAKTTILFPRSQIAANDQLHPNIAETACCAVTRTLLLLTLSQPACRFAHWSDVCTTSSMAEYTQVQACPARHGWRRFEASREPRRAHTFDSRSRTSTSQLNKATPRHLSIAGVHHLNRSRYTTSPFVSLGPYYKPVSLTRSCQIRCRLRPASSFSCLSPAIRRGDEPGRDAEPGERFGRFIGRSRRTFCRICPAGSGHSPLTVSRRTPVSLRMRR